MKDMKVGFKVDNYNNTDKFIYDPHGLLDRVNETRTAITCLRTLMDNLGNTYEDQQNKVSLAHKINYEAEKLSDLEIYLPSPGIMIVLEKEEQL